MLNQIQQIVAAKPRKATPDRRERGDIVQKKRRTVRRSRRKEGLLLIEVENVAAKPPKARLQYCCSGGLQ